MSDVSFGRWMRSASASAPWRMPGFCRMTASVEKIAGANAPSLEPLVKPLILHQVEHMDVETDHLLQQRKIDRGPVLDGLQNRMMQRRNLGTHQGVCEPLAGALSGAARFSKNARSRSWASGLVEVKAAISDSKNRPSSWARS